MVIEICMEYPRASTRNSNHGCWFVLRFALALALALHVIAVTAATAVTINVWGKPLGMI